ncbi:MAG TPA: amidohydrolase family protein [Aliidongia sp.]|uniref:amidohydrolase family protein n=1 Tax=Aliidongia sp. TaxID=1914230 RepID=UPI002DDCAABD|nr:amidohydrolase family protein [Aliidongia sp.]HEV2675113.1 amidohydrolase family protein [Aliidongia sp.]
MTEGKAVLGVRHGALGFAMPAGACDTHVHVFGPAAQFPYAPHRGYTPDNASVSDLLTLHGLLGLERVVLVQPSPYGTDNRRLLAALRELGSRARGIAVIDADASLADLSAMHEAGVRGARVNLESEGQHDPSLALDGLRQVAARVAPLGWHVQTYASLSVIAALHDAILDLPVPLVIDHFGRASAAGGVDQPGFAALLSLVASGRVLVKLSAPCRISSRPDYADAGTIARALIAAGPDHLLWGTDWPHTSTRRDPSRATTAIEPFQPEDDGRALDRLHEWVDGDRDLLRRILVRTPARLYGFPGENPAA